MFRLLALIPLLLAFLLPAPVAQAALATGVTHEVVFANPYAAASKYDYRPHDRIVQLVNGTPKGEKIYFSAWAFTRVSMADAVIAAHKRGVIVYGVASGQYPSAQMDRLKAVLGSRMSICNRAVSGGRTWACMSTRVNGSMHSKDWLFSKTGTKTNVIVTGSTNPTYHGNEANDIFIISGDSTCFSKYVGYFYDRFYQRISTNYMTTSRGVASCPASRTTSYFSPRLTSTGSTGVEPSSDVTVQAATDPVVAALRRLTGGTGCRLNMAERYWNSDRKHVTAQVVRIKRAGCEVRVMTDTYDSYTLSTLKGAGIPVYGTKRTTSFGHEVKLHSKWFTMRGTIGGVANSREVWQGSHNLVNPSLRFADDTLMRIQHAPTADAYDRFYSTLLTYAYRR